MSILAEIQHRVDEKRLTLLKPLWSARRDRSIYLSKEVMQLAEGPWPNKQASYRAGKVQAILEDFVVGRQLVVRLPPSKNVHTVLALLEPAEEQAWEFRIGDPKPGVRVFGRFAAKDIFVATSWGYREQFDAEKSDGMEQLSDKQKEFIIEKKWRDYGIERCKTDWKNLFPTYEPLKGRSLHDYISNARLPP